MKSKFSFLLILWSVMLLLCLGILLVVLAEKDTRPSESENRMLQGMPSFDSENVLSGDMSGEFENFLLDGFFARNLVIEFSEYCLDLFSVQTEEDKLLLQDGSDELQGLTNGSETDDPGQVPGSENTPSTETLPEAPTENNEAISGDADIKDTNTVTDGPSTGGFYYVKADGDLKYQFFTGASDISNTAHALNEYRKQLPEDGNVFYSMIPLKQNYLPLPNNPKYTGWYSTTEEALQAQVVDGVHIVNAPEVLDPHLNEDIYFPIDHHWSALGAYYVFAEHIRMQGLPVTPYSEYTYKTISNNSNWFEVLYPLQDVSAFKIYQKTKEYASDYMNYNSDTYMTYVTGVIKPWTKFETGFSTGRKALVIGDSFANAFAPYLWPYYDEVHMTDVRVSYYDRNESGGWIAELMEINEIDDVYIIVSYANAAHSPTSYERLEKCLYG